LISVKGLVGIFSASFLFNAVLFFLFITDRNKYFSDPSLTIPQIVFPTLLIIICSYYFSKDGRGVISMLYFVTFMFGIFRLRISQFISLSFLVLIYYLVMLILLYRLHPERFDLSLDLLRFIVLGIALFWMAVFGGYISKLRASLAKSNSDLQEALDTIEDLAGIDELTNLYNRRRMFQVLDEEKKRGDRQRTIFTVCLVDLDYFKHINDTYGHLAGDSVLKTFAGHLQKELREIDFLARYGGEEFFVLLPHTDLKQAMVVAERIRDHAKKMVFPGLPKGIVLRVSIGVTEYHPSESLDSLLGRVDKALYNAKVKGRDRVEYLIRYTNK